MPPIKDVEFWYNEALNVPKESRTDFLKNKLSKEPALLNEVMTLVLSDEDEQSLLTQLREQLINSQAVEPDAAPSISRYQLLEIIGQGGMAVVYSAVRTDGVFDQKVAVKLLKQNMNAGAAIRRFEQERNLLAQLKHPNIAQIYDGGITSDNRPYLVMELVEGNDLLTFCAEKELAVTERLHVFLKVCKAVAFAHQNLIIHQDIKPSNLLVDSNGEVKLMDFGIAKLIGPTRSGDFAEISGKLLTPKFASPEQFTDAPIDTRSDVFQLGKLLDLLLDGLEVDHDLQAIIDQAQKEEKDERYDSVIELEEDINNFCTQRPVKAANGGKGYVLKKYFNRNKSTLTLISAAAILLLVISSSYILSLQRANDEIRREKNMSEGSLNAFISIFEQTYPSFARGDTLDVFDLLVLGDSILSTHAKDQILLSRFLQLIGQIYRGYNQPCSALPYYKRVIEIYESADQKFKNRSLGLLYVYAEN